MTREETKQAIQVMQAWLNGQEVQFKRRIGTAVVDDIDNPSWNFQHFEYFVKPKPKLELRVGAWYERKDGLVIQCCAIKDGQFIAQCGTPVGLSFLTREVRVLPVSEGE